MGEALDVRDTHGPVWIFPEFNRVMKVVGE